MAKSPQIEEGLTPIANELVEAFCRINLSAYESRVLWFVARKTYGYHKKIDRISYSQFEEGTGLKRWHVNRAIEKLIKRNILIKNGDGYNLEYGIQKDYDLWDSLPNEVTNIITPTGNESLPKEVTEITNKSLPIQGESLPQQGEVLPNEVTKSLPKEVNTKERKILTKDTTKNNIAPKISFEEYKEIMRGKYPDLDFDNELSKWHEYWYEGRRKCTNQKLTLHNWLDHAREYKKHDGNAGHKSTNRELPASTEYTDPKDYLRGKENA